MANEKFRETIQLNEISDATKTSMKVRIIAAIVAILIVLPCVLFGSYLWLAFVIFLVLVATHEIIKCAKPKHPVWLYIISSILLLALTLLPILRSIFAENISWELWKSFDQPYMSIIVTSLSFMGLFWFVVADENFTVRDAYFLFTIGISVAFGLQCVLYLRFIPIYERFLIDPNSADITAPISLFKNLESCLLILYIAVGTFMTDTGAYFVGILFGKKKINPRISPKKTWEGFFGGLIISTILSFIFGFVLALTGHPILACFDTAHWYNILLVSTIMPIFATLGDFTFSSLKRYYNIKDFGYILPGHGGVLDRIDSAIFTAIVATIAISIIMSITYPAMGGNPIL